MQIETLRDEYGDGWLHSRGATRVHEVLGIENATIEKSYSSEQLIRSLLDEETGAVPLSDCATSTPNKLPPNASSYVSPGSNEVSKNVEISGAD